LGSAAQDEINKLVRNVFVFPNSHAPRAVSFSTVEGNGSSEVCLHTAESLTSYGSKSVCLVDANLYAPSLHRMLGIHESPGLMDALTNPGPVKENAVLIGPGKLWLLPPGSPVPEVQGLFASDRLGSRIAELKEQFDFVLIDLPPVCASADAVLLGRATDGVILVLEANSTRRETARMAKQTLEDANVRLLGAILNNRTFPIPEFLYRKL
jgi:Mrp family chromosome partitioning ATPase